MSTSNGQKSPALQKPRHVDGSKFMRENVDESLFSERIKKLRQSSKKPAGPKELVTVYALRVRDLQPRDVREALKLTTFNPRVIKDISFVARNTLALTLIKSSLPMLQEILNGLFGWTTTMVFDASKPFNPNAPEEIQEQVKSGSIRTYAKYLFRAEYMTKDKTLLAHHRKFVESKGDDYVKAVDQFIQVIKNSPVTYFPGYKEPTVPESIEEDQETENVLDNQDSCDVANTSWADDVMEIEGEINVEYEKDVPTEVEDPTLC
jgi:hypothetical protein